MFMHFLCKKQCMTVLVIADEIMKAELLAQPISNQLHLHFIQQVEEFDNSFIPDACIDLLHDNCQEKYIWLKKLNSPLVIINSVVLLLKKDIQQKYVRINGWTTFLKRGVIEASASEETLKRDAEKLFELLGRKTEWVPDMVGFITPRVISSLINEAFFSLEEKVSTAGEIDIAMKSGTNYPLGPFEWAEKIGLLHVYTLLNELSKQQIRYRPSALLKKTALA
jgi:3-hydroxybutyryl-CoA dehydrogenase